MSFMSASVMIAGIVMLITVTGGITPRNRLLTAGVTQTVAILICKVAARTAFITDAVTVFVGFSIAVAADILTVITDAVVICIGKHTVHPA